MHEIWPLAEVSCHGRAAGLEQLSALRRLRSLPSTATEGPWYRYHNCPGRSPAPIEACRKADGLGPLLRFVLDGPLGWLSVAVVEAGRAQVVYSRDGGDLRLSSRL